MLLIKVDMKKLVTVLISIALLASGCTTVSCNSERKADGSVIVTVEFVDSKIGGVIKGIGDKVVTIDNQSLLGLIRSGTEDGTLLSSENQAEFSKQAKEVADKYVQNHAQEFCNTCPSGHQCQPGISEFKPKIDGYPSVQKIGNGVRVVIAYKWEGAITCSACPECNVEKKEEKKETKTNFSAGQSCEGEENLVLEPGVAISASEASALLQ